MDEEKKGGNPNKFGKIIDTLHNQQKLPSLRTYQGDMAEFIKEKNESVVSITVKAKEKKERIEKEEEKLRPVVKSKKEHYRLVIHLHEYHNLHGLLIATFFKNQKIIYPTTNSGYGIGQEGVYCDENTPLNPITLYGRTKVEAEKLILEASNSVTLRLATVFGISPRMRLDLLVNDFTYRAVYDRFLVVFESHFKRNYIHIRDIAKAFIHCINNFEKMKGEPYNVGLSDANLSKWELCEKIKEQVPGFIFVESKVGEDPDKRNYIISNEKIEKTGFKPDISLEEGITELVKGYQVIKRTEFSNT